MTAPTNKNPKTNKLTVGLLAVLAIQTSGACGQDIPEGNGARHGDGWNCDTHEGIANSLGLEGYRFVERDKAANGQDVEIWKNSVARDERKPGRDDVIRVQHSVTEDCVIVEKDANG